LGRNFLTVEKDPAFHSDIIERLSALESGKTSVGKATDGAGGGRAAEEDLDEENDWEEAFSKRGK